jgi:hypothetical protein
MSPLRLAAAVAMSAVVVALLAWQLRREQLVKACLDGGGAWNGAQSTCNGPFRPILRRDLERG